jgi:nucleoside-diphosphate-sugar epimerase/predicted dehydrogenase
MENKGLRLLIIGSGAVVRYYYLPALRMLGLIESTTIIDPSFQALAAAKRLCPGLKVVKSDFRAFFKDSVNSALFDVCLIALPNRLHAEAVLSALDNGLHVLCEKPLALSEGACFKMAEYAKKKNKILAVNMERRLLPSVAALEEALRRKIIGRLLSVDIEVGNLYSWLSETGDFFQSENGGVLADMGVHYLDLAGYLTGSRLIPVNYDDDSRGGVEANSEFKLRTAEEDIFVRMALSRTRKLRNSVILKGEQGELVLESDTFDSCGWFSRSGELKARLTPSKPFHVKEWPAKLESCFAEQFFRFLEAAQGRTGGYVTAEDAGSVIGLIEWAYKRREQDMVGIAVTGKENKPASVALDGGVFITGGTGFIGTKLIERLSSIGSGKITVGLRNYNTCADAARFAVDMRRVNLFDLKQLKSMISGNRYVIHLAYGKDGSNPSKVTVEGTRNVVEAAISCAVESVIVLSSMYVFGFPKKKQVDENAPYMPYGGEYGLSKANMEQWCLRRARYSGKTRIIILNPSCVYGPGAKTYTELPARLAAGGRFFWVEEGRGRANYTYIDNLLDAILLCAVEPRAAGERFIINDGFCSWKEFLSPLLEPWIKDLPSYSLSELERTEKMAHSGLRGIIRAMFDNQGIRGAVRELPFLNGFIGSVRRCNPGLYERLRGFCSQAAYCPGGIHSVRNDECPAVSTIWLKDLFGPFDTVFSSEKASRILGWKPRIGLEEGQRRAAEWLRYIGLI